MRSTTNTKKYFTTMKKYCILPIFPPHVRKIKEGNSIIEKNYIFTSTIEKNVYFYGSGFFTFKGFVYSII